jgi:hypothetical protein
MLIDHTLSSRARRALIRSTWGVFPLVFFLLGWVVIFLTGLLFVVLAARFATRAVLDETVV